MPLAASIRRLFPVFACLVSLAAPAPAQAPARDGVSMLLGRLEQVIRAGDPAGFQSLLSQSADPRRAREFANQTIGSRVTGVVIRERDRMELPGTLPGDGYQLLVEVFVEFGQRARLSTWRLDVRRRGGSMPGAPDEWGIADQQSLTSLQGLYRLSLNSAKQFAARDFAVTAEDLQLTLESGSVFVAETDSGATALVLVGRGSMSFAPTPKVERGQVRLFAGSESLDAPFDIAFVRLPPSEVDAHINRAALTERPVDPRDLKRAEDAFRQELPKSFGLDLGELSGDTWSLLPGGGDFLAEVRTRRFDTLTYARSSNEVEDISLFDRKNRRNIALYSSKSHLQRYTRFFDEDEQADFVVRHYDVDVSFNPARRFIEGRTRLALETRAKTGMNSLTIRLADSLSVRSVVSNEFGRLLSVRVRNQNAIVVNLPSTMTSGVPITLTVDYGGPIQPQPVDREGLWPQFPQVVEEGSDLPLEENYLYSNRSYWYPQAPTLGYSTASMAVAIPSTFGCAASGDLVSVTAVPDARSGGALRRYVFSAPQPLRYLAFLVTPLVEVRTDKVRLSSVVEAVRPARLSGVYYDDVAVITKANPRLRGRARDLAKTGQDILRFYSSIVGDCPYPTLTLALVERPLPGGHSPAYLSVVAQPAPGSRLTFRDDPASFPEFPEFFMAHEVAHQWWGQAVGWKNYHEQWLSEGFAQYFAALYAERVRGSGVFDSVMRRMQRWARDESDQGPVYLGYRIGHVKGDSRLFRAVIYNKGASVLHMLRILIGDRAFFNGVRRFYEEWRFHKAGSDDLRNAMEAESGVSLSRFFEQWIYGQDLPQVRFTWKVEQDGNNQSVALRLEQGSQVFDVPVKVTLEYLDGTQSSVQLKLTQPLLETRVPLKGTLRRADVDRDETLAIVR
jgi:hypothetical protein